MLTFTLTVVFALLSPVIAAAQTVCKGSVSAWWVVAGLFLWILVGLSVLLGLARLQRKAESKGEAKDPPGGMEARRADGPFRGGLLVVLGIIGILNVVLVADCVAHGACWSLPAEAGLVFLGCLTVG